MGGVLWSASASMTPFLMTASIRYPALAILVALGIAVYFAAGHLLGAFRLSEFRRALRR